MAVRQCPEDGLAFSGDLITHYAKKYPQICGLCDTMTAQQTQLGIFMSYMNRPHSAALTQSLKNHGMDIKRPSQLSDAFRLGWWAAEKEAKQQRAELLEALKVVLPIAAKSNILSVKDYNKAAQAINRAEATE